MAQPADPNEPTEAQPRLQTMSLWIGAKELPVELAIAEKRSLATGMMFRTNIAESEGMLFVFPVPHKTAFWMKNTRVPLSVAYIDPAGVILEIHDLKPFDTNSVSAEASNVQYALETAQGWFTRNGVGIGTAITTDHGPLSSTFTFPLRWSHLTFHGTPTRNALGKTVSVNGRQPAISPSSSKWHPR